MSALTYRVWSAAPDAVRDELIRIWRENLPIGDEAPAKFRWFYEQAPAPPDTVFMLDVARGRDERETVGTAGVGVRELWVRDRQVTAAVMSDLAVDSNHRTLMPALQLVRAARAFARERYPLLYGFPNAKAAAVFRRAGYRKLGTMARYVRVLRHEGYLERLPDRVQPALAARPVRKLLGLGADATRLARAGPAIAEAMWRYRIEWQGEPDARIDELWRGCRRHYAVVQRRTAAFLAWRYPAQRGCRLATLVSRDTGELRAYAVIERERGCAHIRDLFGFPDALAPLLMLLVASLYARDARSVSIRYLGSPAVVETLRRAGFVRRPDTRDIVVDADGELDIGRVEAWHLCDADEDN